MAPLEITQLQPGSNLGELGDAQNESWTDWDLDGEEELADLLNVGTLAAGDQLFLHLTATGFDPVLVAVSPSGLISQLIIDDNSGGAQDAYMFFTVPTGEAGNWTILVTARDEQAEGTWSLDAFLTDLPWVNLPLVQLDYTYDAAGNLLTTTESSSLVSGANAVTTNTYDALGRLQQTKQAVDGVVNKRVVYTYRDDGSVQTVTRYADDSTPTPVAQSVYTYDGMGRLASLTHTPAIAYTWTYDAASRIIGMTSPDGVADDFSYDATDQLTGVDYDYQADESYAYDANGNRQSANGSDYTIDDNNQLTSDGQFTYAYDREGHRTARFVDNDADGLLSSGDSQVTQCAWDHRDRLSGVTQYATQGDAATSSVHYVYDSQGRRTETLVDSDGDGSADEHRYTVFQGDHPCLEVTDADGLGAGQDTQLAHRYLYGQALDEILAVEDGSGMVRWGLADHEGTIRDVLDASGLLVDHRCYDSFGRSMGQTDTAVDFLFGYAGRPWDAQTGLYDNRARWYDPAVGRFLSEDPSGFAGGQDLNLYRYVGNNPWNNTDPSGLCGSSINAAAQSTLSYGYSSGYASSTGSSYFPALSYDLSSGRTENMLGGYSLSSSSSLPSVISTGALSSPAPAWHIYPYSEGPVADRPPSLLREIPGILSCLPSAYWEYVASGAQASATAGWVDGITDAMNPFGGGTSIGPQYGQRQAYAQGQTVGEWTGTFDNIALALSGIRGTVNAIQALKGSGGLFAASQTPQLVLATADGQTLVLAGGTVGVNGQALVAAGQLVVGVGTAGIGVANLSQAYMSAGGQSGGGGTPARIIEEHHQLPSQFASKFEDAGLNIEDFKISLERGAHRLKPDGLHTSSENWNAQWQRFFDANKNPSQQQILNHLSKMRKAFGLE